MISTTSTVHKSLSLAEKRWKGDNVAKEMLTRCAEDAAVRATAEVKDITSRLIRDAAERDQRQAERDEKLMEQLTGLVRGVNESMDGKLNDLHKGCSINGRCLRKNGQKFVHPDDKEVRDHPCGASDHAGSAKRC